MGPIFYHCSPRGAILCSRAPAMRSKRRVPVASPMTTASSLDNARTKILRHYHSSTILRIIFWFIAVSLGLIQAWVTRFAMNPDGVSYLDIGDGFWRGDLRLLLNGYWSPLYAFLLGLAMK